MKIPRFIKRFVLENVTVKEFEEILPGFKMKLEPDWSQPGPLIPSPDAPLNTIKLKAPAIKHVWEIHLHFKDGFHLSYSNVLDADRVGYVTAFDSFHRWYFCREGSARYSFPHTSGADVFLREDILRVRFMKIDAPKETPNDK